MTTAFKDEVVSELTDAAKKVRELRDAKEAARADAEAKQAQIAALDEKIAAGEKQPGEWKDADITEIRGVLAALKAAFDPNTTVSNIFANTPTPAGDANTSAGSTPTPRSGGDAG